MMMRIVLREALLLAGCISVTVAALFFALSHGNSLQWGVTFFSRHLLSGPNLLDEAWLLLLLKLCTPYLFVQSIRAYLWSHRSPAGRRWSSLYFFLLLALMGSWSLRNTWDLFYLMFALGDIPSELMQFLQLEAIDLLIGIGSTALAIRCLRVFINPVQGAHTVGK
jgi:hypothetical protein